MNRERAVPFVLVSGSDLGGLPDLAGCNVFIVTVPTPIDAHKRPDLSALMAASRTVGGAIGRGGVVIYESTVYPGATEEDCVPVVAEISGLTFNRDFYAGYSPERANPGDPHHRLADIVKVTAGSTPEAANSSESCCTTEPCSSGSRRSYWLQSVFCVFQASTAGVP